MRHGRRPLKRVMIGGFLHETNTFNPFPTDLENFQRKEFLRGGEIITRRRGTNTETGGFITSLENYGVEIVPSILATAMPAGIVTNRAFDTILGEMIVCLEQNEVYGVLLSLHGAMVTAEHDDGDGAVLEAVREVVGPDIPIVITLDLHAVLTPLMIRYADAITVYRTYPHLDLAERGHEAGTILHRILAGEIKPVVALSKQPLLIGPPHNVLPHDMPMIRIMNRAREEESADSTIITACPAHGFMQQDVPHAGTGVAVTADRDYDSAMNVADELGDMMFVCRNDYFVELPGPAESIERALVSNNPPVAIADSGDNIGAGTPGDGTALLREIFRQNVDSAFIQLWDPQAAETAARAGIGSTINVAVGGKSDTVYGPPVEITGTVRMLSDGVYRNRAWGGYQAGITENMGLSARIDCRRITVVVTSVAVSPNNIMHAHAMGVYPEDYRMNVCKGGLAFREAYKPPRVNSYIQSDTPGYSSANPGAFTFERITRPIFPLDKIGE